LKDRATNIGRQEKNTRIKEEKEKESNHSREAAFTLRGTDNREKRWVVQGERKKNGWWKKIVSIFNSLVGVNGQKKGAKKIFSHHPEFRKKVEWQEELH